MYLLVRTICFVALATHAIEDHGQVDITSAENFASIYEKALKRRQTASTKLNNSSSRSHSMLIIKVKHFALNGAMLIGKIHLVDLAGK